MKIVRFILFCFALFGITLIFAFAIKAIGSLVIRVVLGIFMILFIAVALILVENVKSSLWGEKKDDKE